MRTKDTVGWKLLRNILHIRMVFEHKQHIIFFAEFAHCLNIEIMARILGAVYLTRSIVVTESGHVGNHLTPRLAKTLHSPQHILRHVDHVQLIQLR